MRAWSGSEPTSANPPPISAGLSPRGSSRRAKGLPRASAISWSRTRGSSAPGNTRRSTSRASSSPSPSTASRGRSANSAPTVRIASRIVIPSASSRRATNASACAETASSHCASSTMQSRPRSSATSVSSPSTARPTRNGFERPGGAQPERGLERLALRRGQRPGRLHQRDAEQLQAGVGQLRLVLGGDHPPDRDTGVRGGVIEQRALADPRLAEDDQRAAAARPPEAHPRRELRQLAITPRERAHRAVSTNASRSSERVLRSSLRNTLCR